MSTSEKMIYLPLEVVETLVHEVRIHDPGIGSSERYAIAEAELWLERRAEEPGDTFFGDNTALVESIRSLLALDAAGALVPSGVCGLARQLLESAAARIAHIDRLLDKPALVECDACPRSSGCVGSCMKVAP